MSDSLVQHRAARDLKIVFSDSDNKKIPDYIVERFGLASYGKESLVHQENIAPEPVLTRKKAKIISEKVDDQDESNSDSDSTSESENNFLWDKPMVERTVPRRVTRSMNAKPPPLPPRNSKSPPAEPKNKGNFLSSTKNFFNKYI